MITLEIIKPRQFIEAILEGTVIYIFIVSKIINGPIVKIGAMKVQENHIRNDSVTLPILKELKEFQNVFLVEEAKKLSFHYRGDYAIEIISDPSYKPLYNLSNIKLIALREYLDAILVKKQICYFTSSAGILILFILKKNNGLRLYINYRGLNKVTIKNYHLLPLISETLDHLYNAKRFIKLNFKDTYY